MSKSLSITATKRDGLGKGPARRLRSANLIPVVTYGHGAAATAMTIKAEDSEQVLRHSGIVELVLNGSEKKTTVLKTVQRHPISNQILHLDFQEVRADEVVLTIVPIISVGEPAGTHQGGQLEQVMMDIEVKSLPMNIPEVIKADVSALNLDEALHVRNLVFPEGVSTNVDPDLVIFNVRAPKVQVTEEPAAAEDEEAAEASAADTKKSDAE
ncbi:MAG: 50S ribosomal protein L25 [Lentisphaeria bacterium]|nr:50S ribosomal protein L25 [Lentisphaeria bacterium]